ncbi:M10 family metallopeptidase C-terminal domain-containing protein [Bradyrhizobium iriomotense]|uniref:Peptidase metallopeptidase domain-containing protein n=1 Tax=Bradyrhizobium iriomotense TaxID=441950 RepID=A0ABQ6ATW3_9BRAD|nr:hypothetical protein GCM10007857_21410 [Bradyrhizobium iriomotense]
MATAVTIGATGNADIDGMLSGYEWTGTITYSFPESSSDYAAGYGSGEPTTSGFSQAPSQMQAAINYAIGLIQGYTNATISYAGTNGADIMVAQSPAANPTSYAYYPGNYVEGGDVWFGTAYNYSLASLGNYYFTTALHELGHAFGLKHSQETGGPANVAVPTAHDDSEYTVMSYRSYVGGPLTGYTNEAYGFPQTYMANDILALQTMYGANYTTHNENTVYTWSPTTGQEFINGVAQLAPGGGAGGSANRIYETIWDGGGVDTYDLSNYTTNLTINLNPGASSVFSTTQLAYLGNGHYAAGNVYNAYLYNNDARSYIDNAIGGTGNDTLIGNAIANTLNGGSGNDTITGGGGNDTIIGGAGTDTAVYSGNESNYAITYNSTTQTFTISDQRSGTPDGTDTVTGVEYLQFGDGTVASSTLTTSIIEVRGATELFQSGNEYFLNPVAGGTGPTLQRGGVAVSAGQFAPWTPIGAEKTSTGYDIAWKVPGADQYTVWSTDNSGNYIANIIGVVSGSSYALESLETTFQQDLNGDGVIGVVTSVIEASGATSLTQVANNYFLYQSGSGPELMRGGAPVYSGQFASWVPIGSEQTSTGYDVAWKVPGADQYTVWSTDSSGNYIANIIGVVSGSSDALKSLEYTFHQDLNGDGVVGYPSIDSAGTTSLTQVGTNYFLYDNGVGPELLRGGSPVVVGQFAPWVPIGAEQTSSGYDVAWKVPGADQYTVWSTDSSGNYIANIIDVVSGTSVALESLETTFNQDLNGDGTIGVVTAVIEPNGATSLTQIANNYFLYQSGAGPELQKGGVAVVAGQFAPFVPIAAEKTATGYDVAWKVPGSDLYTAWSTDNSGNYVANIIGAVSGSSVALQSLETTFHQDLNGDSIIGVVLESAGVTKLTQVDNNYFLYNSSGVGPELQKGGTAVVVGQFSPFVPIAAEQTSTGYDVAWKVPGSDLYTAWSTDANGNYTGNIIGAVSGSDASLEALETTFHQDINGDGVIGAPTATSPAYVAAVGADGFVFAPQPTVAPTNNSAVELLLDQQSSFASLSAWEFARESAQATVASVTDVHLDALFHDWAAKFADLHVNGFLLR